MLDELSGGVQEVTAGQVVAIDGKTVRRSYNRGARKIAIHMVSAWESANGLVPGQRRWPRRLSVKGLTTCWRSRVIKNTSTRRSWISSRRQMVLLYSK